MKQVEPVSVMSNKPRFPVVAAFALTSMLLGSCSALDRLKSVGEKPELSEIKNPTAQPGYKPVQMPMPAPQPATYSPNSLWRNGSRAFFKDQRAMQVGDILTVMVKIADNATLSNETQRSRASKEDSGITDFIGSKTIKNPATSILPGRILTADGTSSTDNKGSVNRQEALLTNVAAVVTQVLPNGNLVVEGKLEEIRSQLRDPRAGRRRHRAPGGHPERQHQIDSTKISGSAHRLWRAWADHRRAATALRPAGDGHHLAVLGFRAPRCRKVHIAVASKRGLRLSPPEAA